MAATFLILRSPSALLVMRSTVAIISQFAWTVPLTLTGVVRNVKAEGAPCTYLQTAMMHASRILDPATLYGLPQRSDGQEAGIWLRKACTFARPGVL